MSYSVNWSPESKSEYAELLKMLERDFGLESALKFMDKTDDVVLTVSTFPESGSLSSRENVRKFVISKQVTLYYEIQDDIIELLHFWDSRQNPDGVDDLFS